MKEQFVTYEIALKLKELGFDEQCLGYFGIQNELKIEISYNSDPNLIRRNFISAPLWQQAIDWLREKHNIIVVIFKSFSMTNSFHYTILINDNWDEENQQECIPNRTYQICREQAILKAIELINEKK